MAITNKFPGRCSSCGCSVAPGEGHAVKSGAGGWTVRCREHAGSDAPSSSSTVSSAPVHASRAITVERVGRRSYLRGDTLAVRGLLRNGGCTWDADSRAWWIGSDDKARALAEQARTATAEAAPRKRITHCVYSGCRAALSDWQIQHSHKFCSQDCARDARTGGQSGYFGGQWHQGDND